MILNRILLFVLSLGILSCKGDRRQIYIDKCDQLSELDYSGFGECSIFMRAIPDENGATVLVETTDSLSCNSTLIYSYGPHGRILLNVDTIRYGGFSYRPLSKTIEELFEKEISSLRVLSDGSVYMSTTLPGLYDMFKPSENSRYDSIDPAKWVICANGWYYLKK